MFQNMTVHFMTDDWVQDRRVKTPISAQTSHWHCLQVHRLKVYVKRSTLLNQCKSMPSDSGKDNIKMWTGLV